MAISAALEQCVPTYPVILTPMNQLKMSCFGAYEGSDDQVYSFNEYDDNDVFLRRLFAFKKTDKKVFSAVWEIPGTNADGKDACMLMGQDGVYVTHAATGDKLVIYRFDTVSAELLHSYEIDIPLSSLKSLHVDEVSDSIESDGTINPARIGITYQTDNTIFLTTGDPASFDATQTTYEITKTELSDPRSIVEVLRMYHGHPTRWKN